MPNSPHLEFRAPPPSPVEGSSARISNAEKLDWFLDRSLAVPDLILPHCRKKAPSEPPPVVDFASPASAPDAVRAAASSLGCFQLVNHGIPRSVLEDADAGAAELFGDPLEKRKVWRRTGDKRHGFEMEDGGDAAGGRDELFWWCRGEEKELGRAISYRMEALREVLEEIASRVANVLREAEEELIEYGGGDSGSIMCLRKSKRRSLNGPDDLPQHDAIDALRVLVRSSLCSHSVCLHVCCPTRSGGGGAVFEVFTKRGWFRFRPVEGALVATVGDQLQGRQRGVYYRRVAGRPVFYGEEGGEEEDAAVSFQYYHSSNGDGESKTISLLQQLMVAACLVILYHIVDHLCF